MVNFILLNWLEKSPFFITKTHVRDRYQLELSHGVLFSEARKQIGMEFMVVIIPRVQELFERRMDVDLKEDEAKSLLKFYMITRARDQVYMLYAQKWPKMLEPVRPYLEWHES